MSSVDTQVLVCDMSASMASSDGPSEVTPVSKTLPADPRASSIDKEALAEYTEALTEDIKTPSAENEAPSVTTEAAKVDKPPSAENDALPKDTAELATQNEGPGSEAPFTGAKAPATNIVDSSVFTDASSIDKGALAEDPEASTEATTNSSAEYEAPMTTEAANVDKPPSAEKDALPKDTAEPPIQNEGLVLSMGAKTPATNTEASSVSIDAPTTEFLNSGIEAPSEAPKDVSKNEAPLVDGEASYTENQTLMKTGAPVLENETPSVENEVQATEPVSDAPSSERTQEVLDNQK